MLSALSSKESSNELIWKTLSHDSIFKPSPPNSFAEEIASELCKRAKTLGNSHPSVITGKQRRIMDGLLGVAEALRKDFPVPSKVPTDTTPGTLVTNAAEDQKTIETGVPAVLNEVVGDVSVKQKIRLIEGLKDDACQNIQNELKTTETLATGEIQAEHPSIHLRLALDNSESYSLPWQRTNTRFIESDSSCSTSEGEWKPPKQRRFRKIKKNASRINYFQTMLKKKRKSGNKLKFRDRILAIVNSSTMNNLRKNMRDFWSKRKSTQNRFSKLKQSIFKSCNK